MKCKLFGYLALLSLASMTLLACATEGQGTATGAVTGGVLGAGAGALLDRHHSGTGAIVGGLGGAVAGGIIGNQAGKTNERMDRQDQAIGQAQQDANTQIVNVPTSSGGFVAVPLHRQGNMWVAPKGDSYTSLPTADMLRSIYGM